MSPEAQSPEPAPEIPDDGVDLAGSEPAHLVSLPAPPPGPATEITVQAVEPLRPESILPAPVQGETSEEVSRNADSLIGEVMPLAMREANIFSLCYDVVRDFVTHQQALDRDAVSLGEAAFSQGSRTPLELAVPTIAIEIYKQVKAGIGTKQPRKKKDKNHDKRAIPPEHVQGCS